VFLEWMVLIKRWKGIRLIFLNYLFLEWSLFFGIRVKVVTLVYFTLNLQMSLRKSFLLFLTGNEKSFDSFWSNFLRNFQCSDWAMGWMTIEFTLGRDLVIEHPGMHHWIYFNDGSVLFGALDKIQKGVLLSSENRKIKEGERNISNTSVLRNVLNK